MNILFLLSSLEPAGSETYCVTLARAWENRHHVFWISDRLHYGQPYTSMPIHSKAIPGGVRNTFRVAQFIRDHDIHVIHSHSRRARWVAAQAARFTGIPHVTTVHQPPPVHIYSRFWPCLGDHTLAIDEAVYDHLQKHFGSSIKKISLLRNPIDAASPPAPLPQEEGGQRPNESTILYIGRLSGGRWKAFEFFVQLLRRCASSFRPTHFKILGKIPDEHRAELVNLLALTNPVIAPSRIDALGFVEDLQPLIQHCTAVIAGGRSALESLAAGIPVIALGEKGVVGLCRDDTWPEAMRSNFGDHLENKMDAFFPARLEMGLRQVLDPAADLASLGAWGRQQVEKHYDARTVAAGVSAIYDQLLETSPR